MELSAIERAFSGRVETQSSEGCEARLGEECATGLVSNWMARTQGQVSATCE